MVYSREQLISMALGMGMSDLSAAEMADEHIARRDEQLPSYVRAGLNASTGKVSAKVARFLDARFGWNAENVNRIFGLYVNRDKVGNWYVCAS